MQLANIRGIVACRFLYKQACFLEFLLDLFVLLNFLFTLIATKAINV